MISFNFVLSYQVFWLFFGMSFCLPIKRFYDNCVLKNVEMEKIQSSTGKKQYNPYLIMFPSFCDVFATILDSTGLIYVSFSLSPY